MSYLPASRPASQWQWWYDTAKGDRPELFCYTSELSLVVGAPIELRVHTTASVFDILVSRDPSGAEVTYRAQSVKGVAQRTPDAPYRKGCDWSVTQSIDTTDWRPGGYVISVSASAGDVSLQHFHWITLRPPVLATNRITLIASTCTWNAYNGWGGSSAYHGIEGPNQDGFSPYLSFDRPLSAGTAWLPPGAPRVPNPRRELGSHVHYDWTDWALSHGYGKHYASAGWATFERHFVRWAEARGYEVDVITQHDLHFRPDLLANAGPVALVGHDEYWTWEMREHLDAFVDRGGQVARLAGNFMWQIRLSDDGALQTCFKTRVADDPVRNDPERNHLLSYSWDAASIGYPGARSFGCSAIHGIYAGFGNMVARGSGGFTIYRPDHWLLKDTYSGYGDLIGAESNAAAYEVDGLDYEIRGGLPYATDVNGIDPESVEIVGLCLAANHEYDYGVAESQLDVGGDDVKLVADVRFGEVTRETLERAKRGSGVLCEYRRGRGRVVSAASCEWVNGLRLNDPGVEQVTHNILRALLEASA